MAESLEDLAELIQEGVGGIEGPVFTDHGYVASRTLTFWSGDRRAHFYFENLRGVIAIVVEVAQLAPQRIVHTGKLRKDEDAVAVADRFLRRRKPLDKLPELGWVGEGAHDELVPHPPDRPSPQVSVGLVGRVEPRAEKPQGRSTARVEGLGGITIYSKDAGALAAWYRDKLGVAGRREGGTWVGVLGDAQLSIIDSEGPLPEGVRVLVTLRVSPFDAFVEQLAARGVEIEALEETRRGKYAYVRDADRNPIELWHPAS